MPHSELCLWKRNLLSARLKREVSVYLVHQLCDYLMFQLGLSGSQEVCEWIAKVDEDTLRRVVDEIERKRKKKRGLVAETESSEQLLYIT